MVTPEAVYAMGERHLAMSRKGIALLAVAVVATAMVVVSVTLATPVELMEQQQPQQGYRVFLKANEPGRGRFQQLPMMPGPMPWGE